VSILDGDGQGEFPIMVDQFGLPALLLSVLILEGGRGQHGLLWLCRWRALLSPEQPATE